MYFLHREGKNQTTWTTISVVISVRNMQSEWNIIFLLAKTEDELM